MATIVIRPKASEGDQKDTWINSAAPGSNFGAGTLLQCGFDVVKTGDRIRRSILQFTLPEPLTPYNMVSATLTVIVSLPTGTSQPAEIRRLTRPLWLEAEATWEQFRSDPGPPSEWEWTNPGGDYAIIEDPVLFSLPSSFGPLVISGTGGTKLVQLCSDAIASFDRQLIIIMKRITESGAEGAILFASADAANNQPFLTIEYRKGVSLGYNLRGRMQEMTGRING